MQYGMFATEGRGIEVTRIGGPTEFMQCQAGINLHGDKLARYIETGDYWMEEKLDGIRAWVWKGKDGVRIWTRNHIDVSSKFPLIVEYVNSRFAIGPWWFDGEITSAHGHNHVQSVLAGRSSHFGIAFRPFDILATPDKVSLHAQSFITRRKILEQVSSPVKGVSDMFKPVTQKTIKAEMYTFYDELAAHKHEGVILKRWDDAYSHLYGDSWMKAKFHDTVSVVPLSIDDETLMVQCGMSVPDTFDFISVANVQVPMEDMMMLINTLGTLSDIKPVIELTVFGRDDKLNVRHPVFKGLRYEAGYDSCSTEQLNTLRKY
jgi:hypothetical protein